MDMPCINHKILALSCAHTVRSQVKLMISGGDCWRLLFGDDDRGTHVEFDVNSLVGLKRILEASSCLTSQALDGFVCCVLYRRIH